jgi:hypothetical protein
MKVDAQEKELQDHRTQLTFLNKHLRKKQKPKTHSYSKDLANKLSSGNREGARNP